jgi:23S rRNA (cytosine1962-C5)-methyltransferase
MYDILDFGNGQRLEQFGDVSIVRPCPAAEGTPKRNPVLWNKVDFRFVADSKSRGHWIPEPPKHWIADFPPLQLELHGTPFGHLGVFPEQQVNWQRISTCLKKETKILNLFAYTGASSIAAALVAHEVVHVDSSKSVVEWAKRNAQLNGVADKIRFITEDARKFVQREIKRGNRYDAVILDPPTYGHGVKGEAWKIADDLPKLLDSIKILLNANPCFVLLTAHSPNFEEAKLRTMIQSTFGLHFKTETFSMDITASTGKRLSAGCGIIVKS